jgi:2'-5' RNA ligase
VSGGDVPLTRLFVALTLPPEVEAHLDETVDGLRTAHEELRWIPSGRWHVTCEFLGECGPHEVERQLGRWERRANRSRPLSLRLSGSGTFPAKAWMARVLWIGLAGDVEAWQQLAAYGQDAHVTIARTRQRHDLTGVVDELAGYAGPSWLAEEVTVMSSILNPGKSKGSKGGKGTRGPRYVPLATFPLGGP